MIEPRDGFAREYEHELRRGAVAPVHRVRGAIGWYRAGLVQLDAAARWHRGRPQRHDVMAKPVFGRDPGGVRQCCEGETNGVKP
jgi:hypothetical protein